MKNWYKTSQATDIDDLMLKGWGAANQLPENNYARKAWDIAFRIAKAATPEQKDIAIRELKNAAQQVLQELWKTKRIKNPNTQEYARKLQNILK